MSVVTAVCSLLGSVRGSHGCLPEPPVKSLCCSSFNPHWFQFTRAASCAFWASPHLPPARMLRQGQWPLVVRSQFCLWLELLVSGSLQFTHY